MAYGATLHPWFGSASIYSPSHNFYEGMATPGFYSSLGELFDLPFTLDPTGDICDHIVLSHLPAYLPVCIASLHILFMMASTRVNAVFFGIFTCASIGFYLFAASLWMDAEGLVEGATLQIVSALPSSLPNNATTSAMTSWTDCLQAAGAFLFITALLGWYLLAIQICASTGFPLPLPVGDFTHLWEKKGVKEVAECPSQTQGA